MEIEREKGVYLVEECSNGGTASDVWMGREGRGVDGGVRKLVWRFP